MTDDDDKWFTLAGIAVILVMLLAFGGAGWCWGNDAGVRKTQAAAVEAGVGEWVVTSPSGHTDFRWKKPEQP